MIITRRAALAAVPMLAVAACATVPPKLAPSQLATDANLIATGLQSVVTALQAVPGIPAATLTTVQVDLALIQSDAAAIATATAGAATSTVQDIATLVGKIAQAVLPAVPNGGAIAAVVAAAEALVPVLLAAVGVAGATVGSAEKIDKARLTLAKGV